MLPHVPYSRRTLGPAPRATVPASPARDVDLQSQLEDILDAVWKAEADWRFNDRIDLAVKHRR